MKNTLASKMVIGSALVSVLLLGSTAFAAENSNKQDDNNGYFNRGVGRMMGRGGPGKMSGIVGTVASVSGSTLTVTARYGMMNNVGTSTGITYTVNAAGATVFKNGATSTVASILVGDSVSVNGTVTGTSVVAKTIRDGVIPGKRIGNGNETNEQPKTPPTPLIIGNGQPVIGGKVASTTGNSITITNASNVTYTVDATNAKIQKGNALTTISSISVGDTVVVQGSVNGTAVVASSIIDQTKAVTSGTSTVPASVGFFGGIRGFFSKLFGF